MRRAVELAERGWGRVAPNPLVGAVVVRDGVVVGEGYHTEYGRAHAEVEALAAAGEQARGATLYVTLEPCSHHGKTPPCTDAVRAAGIRRLVYAVADPNPGAAGGAAALRAAGLEVDGGVESAAARELNAAFLHGFAPGGRDRPFVALKLALSLDAGVADRDGRSFWITGEAARTEVHRLRAGHDAVAVGIGTALADDPQLTVRGAVTPRTPPVRVVFDRALRLPLGSGLMQSARDVPVWILADPTAPAERRAAIERAGVRVLDGPDVATSLRSLRDAGIGSLLCEGGAALAGALLREQRVDRLHLFYAPVLLGPERQSPFAALPSPALADAHRWRHVRTEAFDADTLITLAHD